MTARWVGEQLRQVKERDLQQTITDLCYLLALDCFHVRNARGMAPGWPDLVIIGNHILYRELKTETGVLSAEQKRVGARLADAGADWAVWRPRDLRSGVIERQLRQLTPPPMLPFGDYVTSTTTSTIPREVSSERVTLPAERQGIPAR